MLHLQLHQTIIIILITNVKEYALKFIGLSFVFYFNENKKKSLWSKMFLLFSFMKIAINKEKRTDITLMYVNIFK